MVPLSLFAVALALLMAAPVRSFWIISHHPLVSQRLDRIVAPDGISSHAHAFVGSAAIQSDQSVDDMCTTSPVKADLSNYWAPQLYYYHGDTVSLRPTALLRMSESNIESFFYTGDVRLCPTVLREHILPQSGRSNYGRRFHSPTPLSQRS